MTKERDVREFSEKVAIVTGGSSGIGRATAIAFAHEGAKVVIASRRVDWSHETLRLVKGAGSDGLCVKTDVSREGDIRAVVEETIKAYGRLDLAFNNAGVEQIPQPLVDQTEQLFDQIMNINV